MERDACGSGVPPAQILHHPEKQVAVADPGENLQANRPEAVCERMWDNPSPREACVGLPSDSACVGREEKEESQRTKVRVGPIMIVRARYDGS